MVLGACGDEAPPLEEKTSCEAEKWLVERFPRQLDLLLVVDTSPSMADEQANLERNLWRMAEVLQSTAGGLPDVHIAVISADMGTGSAAVAGCTATGDDGRFLAPLDCPGPDGAFLVDESLVDGSGRVRNYEGSLGETLTCMALRGTGGCRFSQPLAAIRRALDGTHPEHAGFLRPDAYLGIVLITDEDDCSATSSVPFVGGDVFRCAELGVSCDGGPVGREPAEYTSCEPYAGSYLLDPADIAAWLRSVKGGDPNRVLLAGVFGNPRPFAVGADPDGQPTVLPSCESDLGRAGPAVRLAALFDLFPARSTWTSICGANFEDAFVLFADLIKHIISSPCLDASVATEDLDSSAPGTQLACAVSDVRYPVSDRQEETPLPRCPMLDDATPAAGDPRPCWYVTPEPERCSGASDAPLALRVARDAYPPPGTVVIARCSCG